MIAACAIICGCRGFNDFAKFGEAKLDWFKQFLPLENGIPSHDTFNRVFSLLDPTSFNKAIVTWLESIVDVAGDVISIDGKSLRRAFGKSGKIPCIVSAFSGNKKVTVLRTEQYNITAIQHYSIQSNKVDHPY